MNTEKTGDSGFTLVEMMVVIAIIMIMVTASTVYFIQLMKSSGLDEGSRIFISGFKSARQQAENLRIPHFLIFHNETDKQSYLFVVKDSNKDGTPDFDPSNQTGTDALVDTFEMPRFTTFNLTDSPPDLFTSAPGGLYWIKFDPDGTISGASYNPSNDEVAFERDSSWRDTGAAPSGPADCDFIIERWKTGERVYIDWEPSTGEIKKYYSES